MSDLASDRLYIAGGLILLLSFILMIFLWRFLSFQVEATREAQGTPLPAVTVTRDLPALHTLTAGDLHLRKIKDKAKSGERLEDFENRLLARDVKRGDELTAAMLVTREATALLLKDPVQVPIPANLNTMLGGSLKVGDIVELVWFSGTKSTEQGVVDCAQAQPCSIDDLVVVGVPAGNLPPATAPAQTEKTSPANPSPTPAATTTTQPEKTNPVNPPVTQPVTPLKEEKPPPVLVLALPRDKIKDLAVATSSPKWMLARKSHLGHKDAPTGKEK
ncbi:MAG: SAF domain-containing protein [Acidobacteria bacterium]|nr:SAF domain-containing protein [Acidobacteriota bacterium]